MIHRRRCTALHKGCGESLKGVEPSMIHRRGCTPLYKGCGESLKGGRALNDSPQAVYNPFARDAVNLSKE